MFWKELSNTAVKLSTTSNTSLLESVIVKGASVVGCSAVCSTGSVVGSKVTELTSTFASIFLISSSV